MGGKEHVPNQQCAREFKIEAVRLAESMGGNQAAKRLGLPASSVRNWIRLSRAGKLKAADSFGGADPARPHRTASRECSSATGSGRRETRCRNTKKTGGVFREGVAVKYAWIDEHRDQFAITRMCRLLTVPYPGYCQWRERAPSAGILANSVLDVQVAAIRTGSRRSYGRHRILRALRQQGSAPVMSGCARSFVRRTGGRTA